MLNKDFEDVKNSNNEVELLLLWSWQTPSFSLTEGTVDHMLSIFKKRHSGFEKSCKELSERLGTDQFIWCYTYPKEQWHGRKRWELEVPKHSVLAYTCNVAWHWILAHNGNDYVKCKPPESLWHLARSHANPPLEWFDFCNRFNDCWREKTNDHLWDMLFLDKIYGDCTDVLLQHPVEKGWVKNIDKQ